MIAATSDHLSQTLRPRGLCVTSPIQCCWAVGFDGTTHLPRVAVGRDELLIDVDAVARLVASSYPYQDYFTGPCLVQVNMVADWVGKEATIGGETMSCTGLGALG